jgi:crossover junction endodeoxyribonuclease RuvC
MAVILGIDPGSRKTGFGVIKTSGDKCEYLASGVIHVAEFEFAERLKQIYSCLQTIIHEHAPTMMVVEQVFMAKNANSALKLGQARGAAITAGAVAGLDVHEYSARQIKQAVVGTGAAEKIQVQHMVKMLLKLNQSPQEDAADALAAALCHAHTARNLIRMSSSGALKTMKVNV